MSKNVVEPEKPLTIKRMRVPCWIKQVTRAHAHASANALTPTHTQTRTQTHAFTQALAPVLTHQHTHTHIIRTLPVLFHERNCDVLELCQNIWTVPHFYRIYYLLFMLWICTACWSRDMTIYLVLSAFPSKRVCLVATTKRCRFYSMYASTQNMNIISINQKLVCTIFLACYVCIIFC